MSWWSRIFELLSPKGQPDPEADGIVDELLEPIYDLARRAAAVERELIEDELVKLAANAVGAYVEERLTDLESAATSAEGARVRADAMVSAAELAAQRNEGDANACETLAAALDKEAQNARAEIVEGQEELAQLPFLFRVASRLGWAAAPATAVGIGALVYLGLERVDQIPVQVSLTVAAVAGTLATELLLGTLGADIYVATAVEQRRTLLKQAMAVLLALLVFTEGFAVYARATATSDTNNAPLPDASAQVEDTGDLTPNLWWTMPLSVLLTVSGAGAVGLKTIRDSAAPERRRIEDARNRLEEARMAAEDAREQAEELRQEAAERRQEAAAVMSEAVGRAAETRSLAEIMSKSNQTHTGAVNRAIASALLEYRIAAQQAKEDRELDGDDGLGRRSTPQPETTTLISAASLAGIVASLALVLGAAPAGAILAGSLALGLAVLVRRRSVDAKEGA